LCKSTNELGSAVKTWPHRKLHKHDHVVMIGTNWNVSTVETLAKQHFLCGGKVSQVIYDLIPYRYPAYCIDSVAKKFSIFLDRSRSFASQYICISEAVRIDLQKHPAENGSEIPAVSWPLAHEFVGYNRNETSNQSSDSPIVKKSQSHLFSALGLSRYARMMQCFLQFGNNFKKSLETKRPNLFLLANTAGRYCLSKSVYNLTPCCNTR